jgi:hypothetical protein
MMRSGILSDAAFCGDVFNDEAPPLMPARVKIEPRDIRFEAAARRLGLTPTEFEKIKERLFARGFPRADPDTGNYDLDAIDAWRRSRNPQLFGVTGLTVTRTAVDAETVIGERLARFKGG